MALPRPSKALGLLVYALGVAAFFEASARAALSFPPVFRRLAGNDEASFRLDWIHRGNDPGLSYIFDSYHPLRGWTLTPGLRDLPVFGDKLLNSSSKGTRGREEHEYSKPAGRPRILVFGDSFTFGEEVADDETYAAVLEQVLPGTEVINCGVHGYGHDQMLLYLQEEGLKYHPDVVILGFVGFDMERNLLAFRDFAKPRYELRGDALVLTHTPVPNPEEVRAAEPYRSKFLDLLSILVQRSRWALGANDRAGRRLTAALLDEFRRTGERGGARVALAYLPVWHELDWPGEAATEGEAFFNDYCHDRGAACADLRRSFARRAERGEHFKSAGHWNKREHRAAAEALREDLLARWPSLLNWIRPAG